MFFMLGIATWSKKGVTLSNMLFGHPLYDVQFDQHCCPNYDGTKGGTKDGTKERCDTLYIVIDNHNCKSKYVIKKFYSKGEHYCDLC